MLPAQPPHVASTSESSVATSRLSGMLEMPPTSSTGRLALETCLLTLTRTSLFYACHRFLLHALYHDLQSLTTSPSRVEDQGYDIVDGELELETLPAPSTLPTRPNALQRGRGRSLHSAIAQTSFSLCFSESCTLFLMVMCQGLGILHSRSRVLNWNISLLILLSMILLVIPLSQNLLLTYKSPHGTKRSIVWRILLTAVPYSIYLVSLSQVPLPSGFASTSLMSAALSRLIVLGTLILGLLSGFGAVSNAWNFIPLLFRSQREEPSDQDVVASESALLRVRSDLFDRLKEQERREGAKPKAGTSWLSSVVPNFRGNGELSALQHEITGLQALEYQMDRSLESLKQRRTNAKFSRTVRGKLFNWGGRLFAVYCIFRVISSIVNIIAPLRSHDPTKPSSATSYPDLITHLLAYLVSLLPSIHLTAEDISAISREVSLGLVGVIILSSVRLVLRGVSRLLRLTSQNLGASLMLLILAQLMGIYLLSTLVQLRNAFPPPPIQPDTEPASLNLFSTLPEFEVFGSLFDWSFLLSASLSIILRWLDQKVNGVDG